MVALTATNLTAGAAGFDQPLLTAFGPIWINTWVLDNGLIGLENTADSIYICSQQPVDFTSATVTYGLGSYIFGVGDVFNSPTASYSDGRVVSSHPITLGNITANGTPTYWAVIDTFNARLLATGPLASGILPVISGNLFSLGPVTVHIPSSQTGPSVLLPHLNAAIERSRAGGTPARILVNAHSYGAGGGSTSTGLNIAPTGYGELLRTFLTAQGITTQWNSIMGDYNSEGVSGVPASAFDNRIAIGSDWVLLGNFILGGKMASQNPGGTSTYDFTPGFIFNHIRLWVDYDAPSNLNIYVDGTLITSGITENGPGPVYYIDVTGVSGKKVSVQNNGAGTAYLNQIECFPTAATDAVLAVSGNSGCLMSRLSDTSQSWSAGLAAPLWQPDLCILDCLTNDVTSATSASSFQSEVQSIVSSMPTTDFILFIDPVGNNVNWTNGVAAGLISALQSVAAANKNCQIFDARTVIGFSYNASMMNDGVHPNSYGHVAISQSLAKSIRKWLGLPDTTLVAAGTAATAALNLLPNPPSMAVRNKMVTAINALSAAGYWSQMDFFHWLAADTTANMVIDLTGNGYNIITSGSMMLYPGYGVQGDGLQSYGIIPFVPATNGVNYVSGSNSLGAVIANSRTTAKPWGALGSTNGAVYDQLYPFYSGNVGLGCSQNVTSISGPATNAQGVWISTRTSSSNVALYQNGNTIISTTTSTAGAMSTSDMAFLARFVGTSTVDSFSGDTIACVFGSSGKSPTDALAISQILYSLIPVSIPTLASAWGFTNASRNWNASTISDIDTGQTNNPGYVWYTTPFWGVGNPNGSDFTYSSSAGALVSQASVDAAGYRPRSASAGNTSAVVQASISGTLMTVSSMLGESASGGASYNYPVITGQRVSGIPNLSQPAFGPIILSQVTPLGGGESLGGIGRYNLNVNVGTVASTVMRLSSHVGTVFKPGGWFEMRFSFNPTLGPSNQTSSNDPHPTVMMVGLNSSYGWDYSNGAHSTMMSSTELDFLEASVFSSSEVYNMAAINEVINPNYSAFVYTQNNLGGLGNALTAIGSPTLTNNNAWQILWVPTYLNGGTGFIQWFINGQPLPGAYVTYSANALAGGGFSWLPQAGSNIANFVGNMISGENDQFILSWEGGLGQPLNLYGCTVWQTP